MHPAGSGGSGAEPRPDASIYMDDSLVMEVLENMLSNAIRYAGKQIEVMSD